MLLTDIESNTNPSVGPTIVAVRDDRTIVQLEEYLEHGADRVLTRLFNNYMTKKKKNSTGAAISTNASPNSPSAPASSSSSASAQPKIPAPQSKTTRVNWRLKNSAKGSKSIKDFVSSEAEDKLFQNAISGVKQSDAMDENNEIGKGTSPPSSKKRSFGNTLENEKSPSHKQVVFQTVYMLDKVSSSAIFDRGGLIK